MRPFHAVLKTICNFLKMRMFGALSSALQWLQIWTECPRMLKSTGIRLILCFWCSPWNEIVGQRAIDIYRQFSMVIMEYKTLTVQIVYPSPVAHYNLKRTCMLKICKLEITRVRASHELGGFWRLSVTHFFYGQIKANTGRVSRPMSIGFSW